jgi:hypothetical protein
MHVWVRDIKGALTVQVLIQFLELRQQLQNFNRHGSNSSGGWDGHASVQRQVMSLHWCS